MNMCSKLENIDAVNLKVKQIEHAMRICKKMESSKANQREYSFRKGEFAENQTLTIMIIFAIVYQVLKLTIVSFQFL